MRRLAVAATLATLALPVSLGVRAAEQHTPSAHLTVRGGQRASHSARMASLSFLSCASADCGQYTATLNWTLPSFAGLTGYNLLLNGTQVGTSATQPFTFVGMDCGTSFTLGVQPHGSSTTGPTYTTPYTSPACGAAPVNTAEPVVSGTVATGSVLSATSGSWTGSPTSFTYQWQDCATDGTTCSNITGATSSTYTVASGDAGHTVEAVVTAHNSSGTAASGAPIVPLVDNFGGTSVDTNAWAVMNQQGDTSNGEIECYEPGKVTEGSNTLTEAATFTATAFACPGQISGGTPASAGCTGTCSSIQQGSAAENYASGAVQERTAFTYGTVVVQASMAGPEGVLWPAIWMEGANCQSPTFLAFANNTGACNWPLDSSDSAEIDIAEGLASGSLNEQLQGGGVQCSPAITWTGTHTYELDWTVGSLVWKVDGVTKCSTTTNVPSHPMFLIINTAQHGSPASGNFPTSTVVNSVRVSH